MKWCSGDDRFVAVRADGTPIRAGDLKRQLSAVLAEHNHRKAPSNRSRVGGIRVSKKTIYERERALFLAIDDLRKLGFKLKTLRNLRRKHVVVLVKEWQERGLAVATIQTRVSALRTLTNWLGKPGTIPPTEELMPESRDLRRRMAAEYDKSWSGQGVNIEEIFARIENEDPRVAIIVRLQRQFGLRLKEACLLRPHEADQGGHLAVQHGTKGRRQRMLSVAPGQQRATLDEAKRYAASQTDSMIPRDKTWRQMRRRVYYIIRKHGVSRNALGVTPHGLRHERLHEIYAEAAHASAPVRGGANVDRETDRAARDEVAEASGHSRRAITGAYLGQFFSADTERSPREEEDPFLPNRDSQDRGAGTRDPE